MTDTAIIDAVRIAGEQGENTPWATPEEVAHALGQDTTKVTTRLNELATAGILAKDFGWHNTAIIELPDKQHPMVGYDSNQPLFRVL
jgi:hypothetical protein